MGEHAGWPGSRAAHLALGGAHGGVLDDEAVVKLLHLGARVLDGHALAGRLCGGGCMSASE